MNNQRKRKGQSVSWFPRANNINQAPNMSDFGNNWSQNSWSTSPVPRRSRSDYHCRPERRNFERRSHTPVNSTMNRWEIQNNDQYRSYFNNGNNQHFNKNNSSSFRGRFDMNDQIETDSIKEESKRKTRSYKKWFENTLKEDPSFTFLRMQRMYWNKLDPKDDLRVLWKEALKKIPIPPYDGVTPRGEEGMIKAWSCAFCNVILLDEESKKLHFMQKKHYLRYASFCKKYAENKLLRLKVEKRTRKERRNRKTKNEVEDNQEINNKEDTTLLPTSKNEKEKKDKLKHIQQQQMIKRKLKPISRSESALSEAISIDEELNYDFLE